MPAFTLPEDLGTQTLRLRPATDDDATAVHAACQDPEIQRWTRVPSPYTLQDAYTFAELSQGGLREGTGMHLVAVGADDDQLRGAAGLDLDWRDRTAEVGYWVAPDARRQGVASTASWLLCHHAFEQLGIARISLTASVDNPGSNAVARVLGFQAEGTLRSAMIVGPSGEPGSPRGDATVYGLLPGELRDPR